MSNQTALPTQFNLILTTGNSVPVPLHTLLDLRAVGLVRIGKNGNARVRRGCVAYVIEGTDEVIFNVQNRDLIEHHAVKSAWVMLIKAFFYKVKFIKGEPQYEMLWEQHNQVYA